MNYFIIFFKTFFQGTTWKPAYPLNDNTSIPVQILIDSKDSNGLEDSTVYTFTQFRPFLDQDMEEKEHLVIGKKLLNLYYLYILKILSIFVRYQEESIAKIE